MRHTTTRFLGAVAESHEAITRVEVLRFDETVVSADTVTGGTVTLDQTAASRGRVDLTVSDDGAQDLAPVLTSDALAPYGNEIRVSRGIRYAGGLEEFVGLGVFRIDDTSVNDTGEALEIKVTGMDRSASVIDARFEDPYQIAAATNYATAIQSTIEAGVTGLQFSFATTPLVTPQLIAQEGGDRWAFCQAMAASIGMGLFFDGDGICVLRPVTQLASSPVWTIAEGDTGLLMQASKRWSRVGSFNRVIYTGENTGQDTPARGVATDDDPASPTYYFGPFGKVPVFASSSLLVTDNQATDAAYAMLSRQLGTTQAIDFGAIVNPALEPDDLVRITRERIGVNENHIVDAVTVPLTSDQPMTGRTRAVQVTTVGA